MKPKPTTVTELSNYIKKTLTFDEKLNNIFLKGEMSNFNVQFSSGHAYFKLKDENAVIDCIMFRGYKNNLNFNPKDGEEVEVIADIAVYEKRSIYQLNVKAMRRAGVGNLYLKFEELKEKLKDKGYFDSNIKKEIPFYPNKIGVVTSKTGAVIQDIINVGTKRNPNINLLLYPVKVQGEGAAEEISKAIKFFNDNNLVDVLIIGRGGGSLEDLWPFNEEIVADAIYESHIPIISAVGHETDTTISDLVSDVRAATPSQAAEFAVPEVSKILKDVLEYKRRYAIDINKIMYNFRREIENLKLKMKSPNDLINEKRFSILDKRNFLKSSVVLKLKEEHMRYNKLNMKIKTFNPENKLQLIRKDFENYSKNINASTLKKYLEEKNKLEILIEKLKASDPKAAVKRGYIFALKDGKVVTKAKDLKKGDDITLNFVDGEKIAEIK